MSESAVHDSLISRRADLSRFLWGSGSFLLLVCLVVGFAPLSVSAESSPLVLVNADYNENQFSGGTLKSILVGNVHFRYEDAEIYADKATWYRGKGIARFHNDVKIVRPDQTLTCNSMEIRRSEDRIYGKGNIDFLDDGRRVRILAERGWFDMEKQYLYLDKEPRFFRYDSLAGDTMEIISETMEYSDSTRIATALGNVRILKGLLEGTCKTAHYLTDRNMASLRESPEIDYDEDHLQGDSIDIFFEDEVLSGVSVMKNARAIHHEHGGPADSDTMITNITGDSLYMELSEEGRLAAIRAFGDVESRYFGKNEPGRANEASGKKMEMAFGESRNVEHLAIEGNAESLYYIEEETGTGINRASGDRIDVTFRRGAAAYIKITGAVRGIYASRN
jgi:lipopolysaccharide export system protein LptA